MATSFLTNLNEEEFKNFLRQALTEIIGDRQISNETPLPDILDIKQASDYLHLKINTLYEKTSEKTIPHFKKGNKLYFRSSELKSWVERGKVKTREEIQGEAASYVLNKKKNKLK
jgi:excisionase family DNA binding protein